MTIRTKNGLRPGYLAISWPLASELGFNTDTTLSTLIFTCATHEWLFGQCLILSQTINVVLISLWFIFQSSEIGSLTWQTMILNANIDHRLRNKLHGQMHYNIGVMCIQWTRAIYSVEITRQSNPPISTFSRLCNAVTSVWSMFSCYKIWTFILCASYGKLHCTVYYFVYVDARIWYRTLLFCWHELISLFSSIHVKKCC